MARVRPTRRRRRRDPGTRWRRDRLRAGDTLRYASKGRDLGTARESPRNGAGGGLAATSERRVKKAVVDFERSAAGRPWETGEEMHYRIRGKTFEEINIGDEYATGARTVTEADVVAFAGVSGDFQPEHLNEEFATQGAMGARIAHGLLILSMATGLLNQTGLTEGTSLALMEMKVRFLRPVHFGDTVTVVARVTAKRETKKPDRGIITLAATVLNQHEVAVLEAEWPVMLYRKGYVPGASGG